MTRLKAWLLFVIFMGPGLLAAIIEDPGDFSLSALSNVVTVPVSFLWLFSVNKLARKKVSGDDNEILVYLSLTLLLLFLVFFNLYVFFAGYFEPPYRSALQLLFFLVLVYGMLGTARALKSFELGRPAKITECIGETFLFLIFPIGVWFLQPRINRL